MKLSKPSKKVEHFKKLNMLMINPLAGTYMECGGSYTTCTGTYVNCSGTFLKC